MFGDGVTKYKNIIKENGCYCKKFYFFWKKKLVISNAKVKLANKRYTTLKNEHSLTFDTFTIIKPIKDDNSIPIISNNN